MTWLRLSALIALAVCVWAGANAPPSIAEEEAGKEGADSMRIGQAVYDGKRFISVRVGDIELQADSLSVVYADGQRATITPTQDDRVVFESRNGKIATKTMTSPIRGGMLGAKGNRLFGGR